MTLNRFVPVGGSLGLFPRETLYKSRRDGIRKMEKLVTGVWKRMNRGCLCYLLQRVGWEDLAYFLRIIEYNMTNSRANFLEQFRRRDIRKMANQLTLTEIFNSRDLASVIRSYQHCSQYF